MVLKTFNVSPEVHKRFASFCKSHGLSMSKQVEFFMEVFVEEDPEAKSEYLQKLERIRKGDFISVKSFGEHYGL